MEEKQEIKMNKKVGFWTLLFYTILWSFIGFGGGNALMTIIKKTAVDKKKWLTEQEFDQNVIITNLLPGPSAIEMFSYIPMKLLGFKKGIWVTIIGCLPHVLFTFLLIYFSKYIPSKYLYVINVGVISTIIGVLIVFAINYFKKSYKQLGIWQWILLFCLGFVFNFFVPNPYNLPIVIMFLVMGVFFIYIVIKKKNKEKNNENFIEKIEIQEDKNKEIKNQSNLKQKEGLDLEKEVNHD